MELSCQIMVTFFFVYHHVQQLLIIHHGRLGGRQVDGAISSLAALEEVMKSPVIKDAQAEGEFTVLFEFDIRTSDVIRALALGAQGVLCASRYFLCREPGDSHPWYLWVVRTASRLRYGACCVI